jgi:phosphoglycerate dehydrogenase-like enzyme
MRSLKVLFLQYRKVDTTLQDTIAAGIGDRHDLCIYDEMQPIAEQFRGVDVVLDVGGSVGTREMYDAATDARFWQIIGTGMDHIDIEYMKTKSFMVSNCPGQFSSIPLAECAMMYILMLARRYHEASANFRAGVLHEPTGLELENRVLSIVGFGASGQELARRAKAFGMRIQGIDIRQIESEVLDEIQPEFMGTPDDLDRVITNADYLSLHLHLNRETRHIIDARRIGLMKPTACIINVARGALVDEDAMHQALLAGRLAGAGLDVFSEEPPDPTLPVYQLPNVVLTPHLSGATDGTVRRRAQVSVDNVDRIAQGLEPLYRVDL